MDFRRKGARKTRIRKVPASGAGIKYPYLWVSLILFLLASIGLFSSRAQSLFSAKDRESAETKPRDLFPESPVYSPLARSVHFRNIPSSAEKAVPAESFTLPDPGFSWSGWSESQWWVPPQRDPSVESGRQSESSSQEALDGLSYRDLLPRLQSRDMDPQAIMSNFISMGVADLLEDLSEPESEEIAEQDVSEANPFDKALKEAQDEGKAASSAVETEPEKVVDNKESDSANSDSANSDSAESDSTESDSAPNENTSNADESPGGGGSSGDRSLLFIGSFKGRPLATAFGTMQPALLYPSVNNTVFIDLAGTEKQSFDLDVVFRDRDNKESAAFGDLDGDGFIDMVVTNKTTHRAHIFKNDGQGNYSSAGVIFGGTDPSAAVISDFSANGSADIAVGLAKDKTIVVDGKGLRRLIFLPTSYVAEEFSSMIPYDFDGDGLVDLLLSNYENLTSTIYLNKGKGMFAESDSFDLRSFPYLQSVVDLDADGIEDVVYIQCLGGNISVVMVNGKDGTIRNLGNMTLDPSLYFVVGDFNLDGVVDVALAHRR